MKLLFLLILIGVIGIAVYVFTAKGFTPSKKQKKPNGKPAGISKLIVSVIIGIALGVIGSRFLFVGSALSLIPWGIVGLLIGWWSTNRKEAIINGSVYGFLLAFSFMIAGYNGVAPVITRIPFFGILGLVGMICGFILSTIGYYSKTKLVREKKIS